MDEHIEAPGPRRRTFTLTPVVDASAEPRRSAKSRRALILAGSVAIPFISTIPADPAFAKTKKKKKSKKKTKTMSSGSNAKKKGGVSYHPSITGKKKKKSKSKKKKTKKKGENFIRNGYSVAMWQQHYPTMLQGQTSEAQAFPAKATSHQYLANPQLASVFAVPRDTVNGVAITAPDSDLHGALHGRGGWTVSLTHNGETVHHQIDGQFFAEATAAVLNGALYGENSFGMNDRMVIEQVNGALRHLQARALTVARNNPSWEAARILDNVARHITGGSAASPRGETYYLAQLNTASVA